MTNLADTAGKVIQVLRARHALRRCNRVGRWPRLQGRLLVDNRGRMELGERIRIRGTHVPVELVAMPGGELRIGDGVFINSGTSICAQQSVIIGNNVAIGNYTLIMDTDFHAVGDHREGGQSGPVRIENNAWLAARVTVLKGVTIGEGAVVGAGAVVTHDVPPYTVVGGVPARVIRHLPILDGKIQRAERAIAAEVDEPKVAAK